MYTEKQSMRVMICTSLYRLEGDFHVLPGSRLTDVVNVKTKDFIPLTNVRVLSPIEDKVLGEVSYTAINRESIILIYPVENVDIEEELE